jgi:hydrogenase 3 maturation protease
VAGLLANNIAGARRLAVLGIGSELRGDDAAGMAVAESVRSSLSKSRGSLPVKIFAGGTAPENLTGEIRRFKPTHIIIVDSADFRKRPGSVFMFDADKVCDGVTFSTHKMPARILVDYLTGSFRCAVSIVCIQPKTIDFGKPMSLPVMSASRAVSSAIVEAIRRPKASRRAP